MFDSVDRRALLKVLSLYGTPEKYIKAISVMCEHTMLRLRQEMRLASAFVLYEELSRIVFYHPLPE